MKHGAPCGPGQPRQNNTLVEKKILKIKSDNIEKSKIRSDNNAKQI